ncbi:MAG: hypothetical protein JNM56_00480 [Planctomycetia bacterium]|nr:hypothetical protein [Planctomycetia bacterium]
MGTPDPPRSARLSPPRQGGELLVSLAAVLFITAVWYGTVLHRGVPQPSSLIGHGLGVVGFLLMLCTEVLYSYRKRWAVSSRWPTRTWLQLHICTGITGAYLVLLHSAGKFHGLAGWLTLLTLITVASGFVGRYIYTAVPRTLDGLAAAAELEDEIARADQRLDQLGVNLEATRRLTALPPPPGWLLVLGRPWWRWRQRQRLRLALAELQEAGAAGDLLQELVRKRCRLQLQMQSLAGTRQLMALWHFFHVPLGVVLFTLAFVHIGAALYYATFMK